MTAAAVSSALVTAIVLSLVSQRSGVTAAELCQDCSARRALLSDAEVTEIRIEHIKQQILKKLRMTEPPKIEPNIPASLPEPLRLPTREAKSNDEDTSYEDDFYGKLEEIVLFPLDGESRCDPSENKSTICFLFQLPAELDGFSVTTAEFWFYKENIEDDGTTTSANSTTEDEFVVTEVANLNIGGSESGLFTQRLNVKGGWVKANVSSVAKRWQLVQNGTETFHSIHVSCPTCIMGIRPPVSLKNYQKPFLTISVDYFNKSRRQKRSVNCGPGIEECCRENLNISFAALGWDKWIVSPATYNAYHCKGTCLPPTSVTNGNYYHTIIKQYTQQNPNGKVVSCCTAEKFSGLEIIYLDRGIIHKRILPNMVVESCGCV